MIWTKKDSGNLERIANALEELAGKKTFIPSDEKINVEVHEGEEAEEEIEKAEEATRAERDSIFAENKGNHVWEETNIEQGDLLSDE